MDMIRGASFHNAFGEMASLLAPEKGLTTPQVLTDC
jgi:hypothetical protein